MQIGGGRHLTYCTNIHPADGWDDVLGSLEAHAPALKARLSPDAPFGIGLRLSGAESEELLVGDRLARLREWLDAEGLYVFTINGFPHGTFHGEPVKAEVHAPDWRSDERVAYTLRLAGILATLLPEGVDGTISTSPLSYGTWLAGDHDGLAQATGNVREVASALRALYEDRGTHIALAIEPEADGVIATCADLVDWWPDDLDREHVTACFDVCHASVAFEEPEAALDALRAAEISVGKVQLSAALRVGLNGDAQRAAARMRLEAFADPIYLHQVTRREAGGALVAYPDLPEALPSLADPETQELRVHFHVPLFLAGYGVLDSTQHDVRRTLELVIERAACPHLEIETYTWDVLPTDLKGSSVESIAREYEWVLDVIG
jgi:sugar phosphate isomerase/epimerase